MTSFPGICARKVLDGNWLRKALLMSILVALVGAFLFLLAFFRPLPPKDTEIPIPAQSDWVDYGTIFEAGALGEWDYQLWGAFTNTAIKKDGIYYLYYQGASGYRVVPDETVLWRAIGVATSPDGINFTKFEENPVLTWFPSGYPAGNGEEGAVSGGVTLDEGGQVVMFYGANTAYGPTKVHADGRVATSGDGYQFADHGVVLGYDDADVWASRDELFPIAAIQDAGQWFVYYLPNGSIYSRRLGVAWGEEPDNLLHSSAARSGLRMIPAWGTAGYAEVAPDRYALFLNDVTEGTIEVRLVDLDRPNRLGSPIKTYAFDHLSQATVFLDKEANTWFMFYRHADGYGVKLAPAGSTDTTPPVPPLRVTAWPKNDKQIELAWEPAHDPDTGIAQYTVFRDGTAIANVTGWHFVDEGLNEQTSYQYRVAAINYHGVEGEGGDAVSAATPADTSAPKVRSVHAGGDLEHVRITFDEPVDPATMAMVDNYQIPGLCVQRVVMGDEPNVVILETCTQEPAQIYSLTIRTARDRATMPNVVANVERAFTASPVPGLLGAWHFDEGEGEIASDTGNSGSDGLLLYLEEPGPQWTTGVRGEALSFDGLDDQVTIPGSGPLAPITENSYTFAAWIRPDGLPPNRTANDRYYTIIARSYNGLYYDERGRFRAQIALADGTEVAVSSPSVEPGDWHHVAMVVDEDRQTLRLYLDGTEVTASPVAFAGALARHGDEPLYIGASEPLDQRYEYRFLGTVDEVRVFDTAVSSNDINVLAELVP